MFIVLGTIYLLTGLKRSQRTVLDGRMFIKFDRYNIPKRMGRPVLNTRKWRQIKAYTEEIHEKENMTNEQAQDKILKILKQKAENA